MRRLPNVLTFRVSDTELWALRKVCHKNNVGPQDLLRAILIDALVEEGYDALRCEQSERCEGSGEGSEASGATTS